MAALEMVFGWGYILFNGGGGELAIYEIRK